MNLRISVLAILVAAALAAIALTILRELWTSWVIWLGVATTLLMATCLVRGFVRGEPVWLGAGAFGLTYLGVIQGSLDSWDGPPVAIASWHEGWLNRFHPELPTSNDWATYRGRLEPVDGVDPTYRLKPTFTPLPWVRRANFLAACRSLTAYPFAILGGLVGVWSARSRRRGRRIGGRGRFRLD